MLLLIAAAAQARYAGRPLSEALHDLESKGLRLIYSSDVVRPDMIVRAEPRAAEPRRVLDELLREHRLRATDGPQGSILIVRDRTERSVAPGATAPIHIEQITVTPSRFTIYAAEPERRQFLSREEVRSTPHFSDDLYRALARVPGTAGQDVSARFNIRGGKEDEVEVLIDGAEIYDPFHVRDLFRVFSTIDSEAVGAVDVLTGGFPAQYGGRMSGVIDITSLTPSEPRHTEVGVSLLNTRVLSSGLFANGRAEWLVSIRRGYLRELLKIVNNDDNETIDPNYYDLMGKVQTSLDDRNVISANVLFSRDTMNVNDPEGDARANYSDAYAWVNLRTALSPRLFTQNVALFGKIRSARTGALHNFNGSVNADIDDHRSFQSISWKNDTTFDLSERNVLKAGITAKRVRASYDYASDGVILESLLHVNEPPIPVHQRASLRPSGSDVAVYAADRFALGTRLVIEAGLRADRQSYAPDGTHLSPRVNAVFALTPRAALRVAWGRFYQPQGVQELHVQDGETAFGAAERADHALAGIEVDLGHGMTARAEVYDKRFSDLRPRFANLFDAMVLFLEVQGDRIRIAPQRGSARGGELLLRKESESRRLGGWVSYARASVRDEIDGRDVPRSWDQRDTFTFNLSWRPHTLWNFAAAGVYHSGWPTTVVEGRFVDGVFHTALGPLYADRLPAYRRIDLRASRRLPTAHGGFSFFVELFNAFGIDNVTSVNGYSFSVTAGRVSKGRRITEAAIGVVPSFGITYEF